MGTECGCDCSWSGDYEPPEFFRARAPVARKHHQCCECDDAIEPGERYWIGTGKWDGCLDTYKRCWTCHRISEDLCSCAYYGDLWETLREDLGWEVDCEPEDYDCDDDEEVT